MPLTVLKTRTRPSSIKWSGPAGSPSPVDHVAGLDDPGREIREHDAHHRFGREPGECGERSEVALQRAVLELQFEIGPDVGIGGDQVLEDRAVEPQGDDVAAGPDRMWPARAVDEFDLAETVARPQDVERDLVTGFAPFDHAGAARTR